ncbi:hypothetical protein QNM99_13785 [Pseudomonas sp. PCH446]
MRDFREHFPKVRPDVCCEASVALVGRLQRGELDLVLGCSTPTCSQVNFSAMSRWSG